MTAVDYDDMSDFDSDLEITQYYKLLNLCDIVHSSVPVVSMVTSLAPGNIKSLVLINFPKLIPSLSNNKYDNFSLSASLTEVPC